MATKDRTSLKNDFANGKYATGEKFADLIDSMKVVQLPVVDPQALGTSLSFIDSISQDADGKITATKKTLDLANAHELNPFKGWYKTGDILPTDGFDGAYLYFKDTSEQTGLTTIYRWNGTTYADTGTVVDTSNVQTFASGQAVNAVKIKDESGEEVSGSADVLSAEAGEQMNNIIVFASTIKLLEKGDYTTHGFVRPGGTTSDNSAYHMAVCDLSDFVSCKSIKITTLTGSSSASPVVFFDSNNTKISEGTITPTSEQAGAVTTYETNIPSNAAYFMSSIQEAWRSVQGAPGFECVGIYADNLKNKSNKLENTINEGLNGTVYVSASGNDSNDGLSADYPLKTFKEAISRFSRNMSLVILSGDYDEKFDLSYFRKVKGEGLVRFIKPARSLVNFTQVEGHDDVFSTSFAWSVDDTVSFWQKDIPDVTTLISNRLPVNGNNEYRLPHSRLIHVSSLEAMDSYFGKCWLISNGVLYVKTDDTDFDTNPICQPNAVYVCENSTVDITNIQFHFTNFKVLNCTGRLDSVKVFCNLGAGGIIWDDSYLTMVNCEIGGSYGDGINAHTSGALTCYNCYAHDCGDDGESCHEACMVTQYGGLYEYNANGCTPAAGATGEYHGTIVRYNSNAYPWATDTASTSGSGFSSQGGTSTNSTMLLETCLSIGNIYGVRATKAGDVVTVINTISMSNTVSDYGGGSGTMIRYSSQIQSDWTETDNTKPAFIKSKPIIPAAQVQSDWLEEDESEPSFIKNKPS